MRILKRLLIPLLSTFIFIAGCHSAPPPSIHVVQHDGMTKQSLFDGQTLQGWKITPWTYRGPVEVQDGNLTFGVGHECTGVTWTQDFPNINYQVDLDAMRVEGNDFFCGMTFPVGEEFCSLIIGGWGGTTVGLSSIDGQDASENMTGTLRDFDNNKWYHIRLLVTKDSINAWVGDDQIVEFATDHHRLSLRMEVLWSKPFGICSWQTKAALKNIMVRYPVTKEIKVAGK